MDRVLDRLFIGSAPDLDGRVPLRALGFSAVVDLRDGHPDADVCIPGVAVHRVRNRDGDPWSAEQVEGIVVFVHEQLRRGKVLVACAAGMSRSACVVIGYLVRTGWDPSAACEHVRRVRPQIAPVVRMLDSVLEAVEARGPGLHVVGGVLGEVRS